MRIGVPKEIKPDEYRVGVMPVGAEVLVKAGHQVSVESSAGASSGFRDDDYRKAGATIAAENGATPHQLMAIFGWKTLEQAEVYTRKVRQQRVAGASMGLLSFGLVAK